jgi:UDP-GlcNAc:undecaprenyl-phosphate GlcNAc-1-phosphate transferase
MDVPDGRRKHQAHAIPTAGGPAVFLAALIAICAASAADHEVADAFSAHTSRNVALLVASAMIITLGLLDDRFNLKARYKLIGQVAAILVLVVPGGFLIEKISCFGWHIEFGTLAIPATGFWLLTCVNALNLIDGMDGLLGLIGLVALGSLAIIACMAGQLFPAAIALAMAGAIIGFLWFNLPPASIYMGDAGSMLIGLIVGAIAIPAAFKGPATVAFLTPVAILILPMTDTAAAVIRRKLTGRGLATTDRGHLHHVMQRHGLTTPKVLAVTTLFGLCAACGAFATTLLNNDVYAFVAACGVVMTLVGTRLFGHAEFRLVVQRLREVVRTLFRGSSHGELCVHLQGTADWDRVWQGLTACADELDVQSIRLDVNAPALHENYHARWERAGRKPPEATHWRFEIPLSNETQPIGRLTVVGGRGNEPIMDRLMALAHVITAVEVEAIEVTRRCTSITNLDSENVINPPTPRADAPVLADTAV